MYARIKSGISQILSHLWLAYFLFCITHKNNIIFNHLHDIFHFNWVSSFYSILWEWGKCFNYYKYCIMYILRYILSVFIYLFYLFFFLKPFLVLTNLYIFGLDTVNKSSNIKIWQYFSNSFIGGYYDSDKLICLNSGLQTNL